MLSGDTPFQASNDLEVIKNIKKGRLNSRSLKHVSRAARNLISRMLEPNPLKRITMRNLMDHDWFTSKKLDKVSIPEDGGLSEKKAQHSTNMDHLSSGRQRSNSDVIGLLPFAIPAHTSSDSFRNGKKITSLKKKDRLSGGTLLLPIKE